MGWRREPTSPSPPVAKRSHDAEYKAVAVLAGFTIFLDPVPGTILTISLIARIATSGSKRFWARVIHPLATVWTIAMAILIAVHDPVVRVLNPHAAEATLAAFEATVARFRDTLSYGKLSWGWTIAALAMLMIVAIYQPNLKPVTTVQSVLKITGQAAGLAAILGLFTSFAGRTSMPEPVEPGPTGPITRQPTLKELQTTFDRSKRTEAEIWKRYFAQTVMEEALRDPQTARILFDLMREFSEVPNYRWPDLMPLVLDVEHRITEEQEVEISKQLDAWVEKVGQTGTGGPQSDLYAARFGSSADWRTNDIYVPALDPAVATERVQKQHAEEREAGKAAQLDAGFKAILDKTANAPVKHGSKFLIEQLLDGFANTSPFTREIVLAVGQGAAAEAMKALIEKQTARALEVLRSHYWPQPRSSHIPAMERFARVTRAHDAVAFQRAAHETLNRAARRREEDSLAVQEEVENWLKLAEVEASHLAHYSDRPGPAIEKIRATHETVVTRARLMKGGHDGPGGKPITDPR